MTERYVYAILLPLQGREPEMWCVCRAETPETAGNVVTTLLNSGDKKLTLIHIQAEVRIE